MLPINPYVLGVILGDGCLTNNTTIGDTTRLYISSNEEDIISKVANILNCNYEWHKDYNYTNVIYGNNIIELDKSLKLYNLRCKSIDKYIPEIYLMSSIEQRKELLKGLIDTDGYIDTKGCFRFSTSSNTLIKNVIELCRSLGYIVGTISEDNRGTNVNYSITIQTNDIIFTSNKHKLQYKQSSGKCVYHNDHIGIASIEEILNPTETTCIL